MNCKFGLLNGGGREAAHELRPSGTKTGGKLRQTRSLSSGLTGWILSLGLAGRVQPLGLAEWALPLWLAERALPLWLAEWALPLGPGGRTGSEACS